MKKIIRRKLYIDLRNQLKNKTMNEDATIKRKFTKTILVIFTSSVKIDQMSRKCPEPVWREHREFGLSFIVNIYSPRYYSYLTRM